MENPLDFPQQRFGAIAQNRCYQLVLYSLLHVWFFTSHYSILAAVYFTLTGAYSILAGVCFILAGVCFILAGAYSILADVYFTLAEAYSILAGVCFTLAGAYSILAGVCFTSAQCLFISAGVLFILEQPLFNFLLDSLFSRISEKLAGNVPRLRVSSGNLRKNIKRKTRFAESVRIPA